VRGLVACRPVAPGRVDRNPAGTARFRGSRVGPDRAEPGPERAPRESGPPAGRVAPGASSTDFFHRAVGDVGIPRDTLWTSLWPEDPPGKPAPHPLHRTRSRSRNVRTGLAEAGPTTTREGGRLPAPRDTVDRRTTGRPVPRCGLWVTTQVPVRGRKTTRARQFVENGFLRGDDAPGLDGTRRTVGVVTSPRRPWSPGPSTRGTRFSPRPPGRPGGPRHVRTVCSRRRAARPTLGP